MRNVWLGMVVGALTGAGIGALADGTARMRQAVVEAGHNVARSAKQHMPQAAATVRHAGESLADNIRDATSSIASEK